MQLDFTEFTFKDGSVGFVAFWDKAKQEIALCISENYEELDETEYQIRYDAVMDAEYGEEFDPEEELSDEEIFQRYADKWETDEFAYFLFLHPRVAIVEKDADKFTKKLIKFCKRHQLQSAILTDDFGQLLFEVIAESLGLSTY